MQNFGLLLERLADAGLEFVVVGGFARVRPSEIGKTAG
jgi:hypothetical protein